MNFQKNKLMSLSEIAQIIYDNSNEVKFGDCKTWNHDTMKSNWFLSLEQPKPNKPGLYWFLTNSVVKDFERPKTLPKKGCDFKSTSERNLKMFTSDLLTKGRNGLKVVYNDKDSNVMRIVRQHFYLTANNHKTGALGLYFAQFSLFILLLFYEN